jgi:hypothetical protein
MTDLLAVNDAIAAAPISFLLGVVVGWVISSRYRIMRVNGKPPP